MNRRIWLLATIAMTSLILWLLWDLFQNNEEPLPYPFSPMVRVLLRENQNSSAISSGGEKIVIQYSGTTKPLELLRRDPIQFGFSHGAFNFAGFSLKGSQLEISSPDSQLVLEGQCYTGKIFLHASGNTDRFDIVLHTPLEHYVARVVDGEMKSSWPRATLEAQAIAARSFAVYHLLRHSVRPYDLRGDARAQAFARNEEHSRCRNAAIRTESMVLLQNKTPLLAYYINTCGGETRFFSQGRMHYESVPCTYCKDSPFYIWQERIPENILRALLGKRLPPNATIESVSYEYEASQHVANVIFRAEKGLTLKVNALDFRRYLNAALGKEVVKSLRFELNRQDHEWIIIGHGWGYHGIGLCQYGAKRLGELGQSSSEILHYYYPNTEIGLLPTTLNF